MREYIVPIDDLKAIVEGRDIKHGLKTLVRCKDCFFHGEFDENGYCVCECTGAGMPMDGFCSDGERKKTNGF